MKIIKKIFSMFLVIIMICTCFTSCQSACSCPYCNGENTSSSNSETEKTEPVLKDKVVRNLQQAVQVTDDGVLSPVKFGDIDIHTLLNNGYQSYDVKISVRAEKRNGVCAPLMKLYGTDRPEENLNVWNIEGSQPAKYKNEGMLLKKEFDLGERYQLSTSRRSISELLNGNCLYIYFVAQGTSPLDAVNNSFTLEECTVTIQFYK